ncbi:hypothetical protein CERZMDRAFT_96258 [Cercospora zeae-maydis SCOH1-5]|uniref:Uncharacterized protein n=1 Tax=Cercospora zeae-maydis SCOH1-5 TaxID=717836 RepID=A0A6A6FJ00_9PEZI|nr:hypothetical protein CERZMDRAFT_96258 [Cercospora zeae-maydis SCOH1-5]
MVGQASSKVFHVIHAAPRNTFHYHGEKRTHSDNFNAPGPTKRARLSPTARLLPVPKTICSVAISPTDRENLEKHYGSHLDLARINEKLNDFQQLRDWAEACRSDDESSFGDDKIAQLLDWGDDEQRDTPMTQYDDEDETYGIPKTWHEASNNRQWDFVAGWPDSQTQHKYQGQLKRGFKAGHIKT